MGTGGDGPGAGLSHHSLDMFCYLSKQWPGSASCLEFPPLATFVKPPPPSILWTWRGSFPLALQCPVYKVGKNLLTAA